MSTIYLNFGPGSDESDVGLGFRSSFLFIDFKTNEIGWDFLPGDEKRFSPPKSDKPEDVIEFILSNYDSFFEEETLIELFLDILKELSYAGLDVNNNSASEVYASVKCSDA